MSAFAASIRNFGLDVRAGGPRRSHASSLRIRLRRRRSGRGLPVPLGPSQDVRRVPAVVRVEPRRPRPPRSAFAGRVEEPPVVGDDDEGPARVSGGWPASQLSASKSRWLVGSSSSSSVGSASEQGGEGDPATPRRRRACRQAGLSRCRPAGRRGPARTRVAAHSCSAESPTTSASTAPGDESIVLQRADRACRPPTWVTRPESGSARSCQDREQGGLTRAVATDHPDPLAVRDARARRRSRRCRVSRRPCRRTPG